MKLNPAQFILILLVKAYRHVISPAQIYIFGAGCGCRFTPTCSEYALDAVETHGALAGTWLTIKRIGRCHPWSACGHDPVHR